MKPMSEEDQSRRFVEPESGRLKLEHPTTLDLPGYTLNALRQDEAYGLHRASSVQNEARLVLSLTGRHLTAENLERLEHELSLREFLDADWAARPIELSRDPSRALLFLEDGGGLPLDALLAEPRDLERSLGLALGLAHALDRLHQRGIIHKDIKPANVLADPATGRCWLTGFGIASRLPRERQGPEPPEFIAGTLAYMAPEQTGRMNRSIDTRSDLYSLGVTLYEMLTGTLPFVASDPLDWVHCHIARQPVPPSERVPHLPLAVAAIVMKLLAKNAEDRYQTAAGVTRDLERCLHEFVAHRNVAPFALGHHETPGRMLVPERLYGRAPQIEILLRSFDRVVETGRPELTLVAGYSGIGKSSVVNELHRVLVLPRGRFASGKFDQYKRDIPYATLAQAFQGLVRPLLGTKEDELRRWRKAFEEALGPNARLMVDLVPELRLLIGEPPPVPDLPATEAQRRFQLVLRRFIGVFACKEHPLALFLDDLQWLDGATLDLLEDLLTQPDVSYLMVIGAYRDHEVHPTHPLARRLEVLRTSGAPVHEMNLGPLTQEDVEQLLANSFRCESTLVAPLARIVYAKTAGNPFFAIQFANNLVDEGMVSFDTQRAEWRWDLQRIVEKAYTDNVVELMVTKVARLPAATKVALQALACLGSAADLATIAVVLGLSDAQVRSDLWEAARLEFVTVHDATYRFVHDRVQEAAYSLVPSEARAEAHLRIGRLLIAHTPPERRFDAIFELVSQVNRGAALLASSAERRTFAELNLLAGRRAKAATAYGSALKYLCMGVDLLGDGGPNHGADLLFELELNRAECEFMTGEGASAEARLDAIWALATTEVQRSAITCLRVDLYTTTLNRSDRAVDVCLEYLRQLGMDWSPHPTADEARREYERVLAQIGDRSIEELVDLPLMDDPTALATLDVVTKIILPANFIDPNLSSLATCRAVNLTLEGGNADGSCVAYLFLAQSAGPRFGNYKDGYRFGRLGYELVEKRGLSRFKARTYLAFATFVLPWTRPLRESRDLQRRTFEVANASGDLMIAGFACNDLIATLLAAGEPLVDVQAEAESRLDFARKARAGFVNDIIQVQLQLVRSLRALTPAFGSMNDEGFDEAEFEEHLGAEPSLALPECWYWIRQLELRFFARDYHGALAAASKARALLWTSPSIFETAEYEFYAALAVAALLPAGPAPLQEERLNVLIGHQQRLKAWAENCPDNFETREALVAAEIARIEGRLLEAERLYEQAIRAANVNGFVHNEAIAKELAGRFYAARGFDTIAQAYVREARNAYSRWGAVAKVRQLDDSHPHLGGEAPVNDRTGTIAAPVEQLDLATVLGVARAVTGENALEKLLDTLMRTALVHAGAERGVLVLLDGNEPQAEAEATTSGDAIVLRLRAGFDSAPRVAESIVHYVLRTHESVILDDAALPSPFSSDSHLRGGHARSVLCLPLVNQAKIVGALYLENNLSPRVFSATRISALKFLASLAAISVENARLYRDLRKAHYHLTEGQRLSHTATFTSEPARDEHSWSDEFYRICEFEPGSPASIQRLRDIVHPEDVSSYDSVIERGIAGHEFDFVFRIVPASGAVKHVHGVGRIVGTNEGRQLFLGAIQDVTASKLAEQALMAREAELRQAYGEVDRARTRLRQTLDSIPSLAWSASSSGAASFTNRRWTEYTGQTFEEAAAHGWQRVFRPADRPVVERALASMAASALAVEFEARMRRADGVFRWFLTRAEPLRDSQGEILEWFATSVDIEERKRAEAELEWRTRLAELSASLASAPLDRLDDTISAALEPIGELFEIDRISTVRIPADGAVSRFTTCWWREGVPPAMPAKAPSELVYETLRRGLEYHVPGPAGDADRALREEWAQMGIRTIALIPLCIGGEVIGGLAFTWLRNERPAGEHMVGRLRQVADTLASALARQEAARELARSAAALDVAQRELARVARVTSLGVLAASIVHEVNQPLSGIVTNAGTLRRMLAAAPPNVDGANQTAERIVRDGNRAADVVARLRTLFIKKGSTSEAVDLNDATREVIALTIGELQRNKVIVTAELTEDLPLVQGDRVQLQQVILNLLLNASEAMRSVEDRPRQLFVETAHDADAVRLAVRDTGVGVAPDSLSKLFDPFFTTKADGMGIGLSVSRTIVDRHAGRLWATPNDGHGVTFAFSIPRSHG
jgi:PAS domain S-box-containing protein